MALILGTEYCKMDSNGRFKVPTAFKKQLASDDSRFVIRQGFTAECLELWTFDSFQIEVQMLSKRLNEFDLVDRKIIRQMTRANIVELDSNDRLMVPPERKSVLGNAKEIVLQSTGKCIEIWERNAYDKMNDNVDDLAELVNKRLGGQHELPSAGDAE